MCMTFDGSWRTAKADMFAYKIIRDKNDDGKAWSMFRPDGRLKQSITAGSHGNDCAYEAGDHVSPKPGFYLMLTREAAQIALARYQAGCSVFGEIIIKREVIRVKIPAGAEFITGRGQGYFSNADCVNALVITVE